jgi:hypothetical protein
MPSIDLCIANEPRPINERPGNMAKTPVQRIIRHANIKKLVVDKSHHRINQLQISNAGTNHTDFPACIQYHLSASQRTSLARKNISKPA